MPKKSSSKKSLETKEQSKSTKLSQEQFESSVLEIADKGLTAEKIGEALRRQGIYSKEYNKKISRILKEKKKYVVPEMKNIEAKLEKIKEHYQKNKQDKQAMRNAERVFSKLRKLKQYHKAV